jgi:hypothetical protein
MRLVRGQEIAADTALVHEHELGALAADDVRAHVDVPQQVGVAVDGRGVLACLAGEEGDAVASRMTGMRP